MLRDEVGIKSVGISQIWDDAVNNRSVAIKTASGSRNGWLFVFKYTFPM